MPDKATRRDFLKTAAVGAAVASLAEQVLAQTTPAGRHRPARRASSAAPAQRVSILCLGGWHIGSVKDDAEAIRIMHAAIDEGITFFDNAWDYHDGRSEELMGKALAEGGRRQKVFLMTKNCARDDDGHAAAPGRQPAPAADRPHRPVAVPRDQLRQRPGLDRSRRAACARRWRPRRRARSASSASPATSIPHIHLKMLAKPHDWDTAQMPVNVWTRTTAASRREVVPEACGRNVGVIGMKSFGGSHPPAGSIDGAGLHRRECYRYALSQPVAVAGRGHRRRLEHLEAGHRARARVQAAERRREGAAASRA